MSKDYHKEFNKLVKLMEKGENFAFTRYSDGELDILKNKYVILAPNYFISGNLKGPGIYTEEEQKEFIPEEHQFYREKLIESFKHNQKNYFKGICTSTDLHVGNDNFKWMIDFHGGSEENLTFANLLINANYSKFIDEIVPILTKRDIIYVVNKLADISRLPFEIKKTFRIGTNCMINDYDVANEVKTYIATNNIKDHIILCSAASLSNFIIYESFKDNPHNSFLDIGSCLNPLLDLQGWPHTRGYLTHYWMNHASPFGTQVDVWK